MAAGPFSCWAFTPTLNTSFCSVLFCLLFLVYSVYMHWYIKCCPPSHEAQFIIIPLCIHLYPYIFFYFPFILSPLRSTVKSVTFSLQFLYFHLVLCFRHDVHHFLFHKTWAPPSSGSSEVVSCGFLNVVVVAALKSFSVTPNICILSRSCLLLSVSCAWAALLCLSLWLITAVESCTFQSSGGTSSGSSSPAWTLLLARWLYCLCIFEALSALLKALDFIFQPDFFLL